MKRLAVVLGLIAACKGKQPSHGDDAPLAGSAAAVAVDDAHGPWPELANLPTVTPLRVIAVPAKTSAPLFTVGGPAISGDLAIVASSRVGFCAIDYKRGQIAWTKPAGAHVAPPLVADGNVVLVGDCINPPDVPDSDTLLGCARVVTPVGADQAYVAIHAKKQAVAAFAGSDGAQAVWPDGPHQVVWRRGDQAVAIDLLSGVATQAPADDPPVVIPYKDRTWRVRRTPDGLIRAEGTPSWTTEESYGTLLGAVYIPDQAPMVRVSAASRRGDHPELLLLDIDATGSLHGQVSMNPAPGIGLVGHAISSVGDVALAVRLDASLDRSYIAGYAAM